MLSKIKPKAEPILRSIAKPFAFLNPNLITILGIIPPVLFLILMINHQYAWALVALLGSAVDMIDGAVARMTNRVTLFGGVLDSVIDRIADIFYISAFGFATIVRWEIVIPTVGTAYLISYIRSRAELAGKGKFTLNVGLMERTERTVMIFFAVVAMIFLPNFYIYSLNLAEVVFVILFVLSGITVFRRLYVSYQIVTKG